MKRKIIALIALLCVSAHFSGCGRYGTYTENAYYSDGFIITYSGQMYYAPQHMESLPNNAYISVTFNNRGTKDFIDDTIVNITWEVYHENNN